MQRLGKASGLLTVRRGLEQAAKGSTSSKMRKETTLVMASVGRRSRQHMMVRAVYGVRGGP
jgi:hypothetical protein